MATTDDDDNDALQRQLGGPPTSTTMPVPRVDPRDPRFTSANAPRVSQNAQGQWQLQEHGNTRNLVGDEVGQAKGYADQFWKDNPTGFQMNDWTTRDAYKQFLGRDPDAAGLAAHAKNPGGQAGVLDTIINSPEATARRNAAPITNMGLGGAATGGATTPGPVTAQTFKGFTPKYAMEGFDFNREQNTGKSAKDAFAYLANQAPPPPIQDKAALGAWFKQYIEPGMNALGHKVTNVEGDKFGFENWQGKFNVDYGRGAGAEGGALAWQVDDPSAVLSNAAYQPGAQTAASNPALSSAIAGDQQASSQQDEIRKIIDAEIAGRGSPLDEQALLAQLQV